MNKYVKIALVLLLLLVFGLFYFLELGQYLNLEYIKSQQDILNQYYLNHRLEFCLLFFLAYIFMAALSIPGATVFTLLAGAIFGLVWGTVIVSFASTIGATLAFLISRYLLKDSVESKYAKKLSVINKGIKEEGGFYLFSLRLVPAFPFFLINLLMGITSIRTGLFYLVSQIGMLPATIIYVNTGTQLAAVESLSGILSPGLIIAFILLGLFPLIAKKLLVLIKERRQS